MKHKDGTYDLTVDDIHEIRVKNSRMFESMTDDEICDYIEKRANDFFDHYKNKREECLI